MAERNRRLSTEIPNSLESLFAAANSISPDAAKVKQIVDALDNSLAEAITVRIDQTARNNSTVNALAIVNVLDETMEDYGIATGAEEDEEGGSNMSMSEGDNMSSTSDNMSGSSSSNETTATIVNVAAHQTAQGLAVAAQNMFNDLKANAPANTTESISKLDKRFCRPKDGHRQQGSKRQCDCHCTWHAHGKHADGIQAAGGFRIPLATVADDPGNCRHHCGN